jgi:two-component system sensor histidine kinase/response regulator
MTQSELECRFRADGAVTFANDAYCEYFDWSLEGADPLDQPPHLVRGLDGWPQLNLLTLTPKHAQINHESRIRSATGNVLWQQWYNQGFFDDRGRLLEIRAVGRDITRYKLAELRLQRQIEREQALGRMVDRLRQSFELPDILTIATQEARQILRCDRVSVYQFASDWSGCFVAESVAPGWLPLVRENQQTIWADTYLQEHEGGRYRQGETFAINDIYLESHAPCHLDVLEQFQVRAYAIVPIFRQDQLWGLLSAYQNRGPRRWQPDDLALLSQVAHHLGVALYQVNLLEQAQQAKDAAERANRAKSDFLSHMSHELRTPLNAIIGYAQYLLRDRTLSTDTQSYLDTINASGEHLLSLINTILSMAKIEAGQMTITPTDFSLPDLVQRLVDMLLPRANDKGLTLTFHLEETLPPYICTDQGKLQQMLLNLLDNAIKFTETGSVSLTVQALPEREEGYGLLFIVNDTGSGIDETQAQRLFQPFSQAEAGRAVQNGTGLGLSISRQFAQLLGGELILASSDQQGSTFHLQLPVTPLHQVKLKPRQPARQVLGLAPDQAPVRILVADDNEPSRRLLVKLLETVGFEVQAATHGQGAIERWQAWNPHLIFMDLRMPVLDGYQATAHIKQVADPAPVIVALTASAFDEEEQTALDQGCDGFLRKPIREVEVFDEIFKHLGVRYLYVDHDSPAPSSQPNRAIDAIDLAVMPTDWVNQLYQSAIAVNNQALYTLIGQIPQPHEPLAQTLRRWVEGFRCDKIIELVERVREATPTETDHPNRG